MLARGDHLNETLADSGYHQTGPDVAAAAAWAGETSWIAGFVLPDSTTARSVSRAGPLHAGAADPSGPYEVGRGDVTGRFVVVQLPASERSSFIPHKDEGMLYAARSSGPVAHSPVRSALAVRLAGLGG